MIDESEEIAQPRADNKIHSRQDYHRPHRDEPRDYKAEVKVGDGVDNQYREKLTEGYVGEFQMAELEAVTEIKHYQHKHGIHKHKDIFARIRVMRKMLGVVKIFPQEIVFHRKHDNFKNRLNLADCIF